MDPVRTSFYYSQIVPYGASVTLTSITVDKGSGLGGTATSAIGTGFVNGATITVDGVSATGVVWVSATQVDFITPAIGGAGAHNPSDVTLTNPDLSSATLVGGFTYDPVLTSLSVTLGTPAGGTAVVATGKGFITSSNVIFGFVQQPGVVWNSITSISFVTGSFVANGSINPEDVWIQAGSQSSKGVSVMSLVLLLEIHHL